MKFKIKRHYWIWALWVFFQVLAIRFFQTKIYFLPVIIIIFDIFFIFPEASHLEYEIKYRQLTVKRFIYPDISFPCDAIIAVEKPRLFYNFMWGNGYNLGAYKIIYFTDTGEFKMPTIIIGAKNRQKFLLELASNTNADIKININKLLKDDIINGTLII